MNKWRVFGIVVFGFLMNVLHAQEQPAQDTIPVVELALIPVTALRIPAPNRIQPFSVATYQAGTLQEAKQQLSLQEYLTEVPGLFSQNANNYAQDLRIAIRGFGARSAFGIRGIKIIVDGIPETTPDGQGQIDNLNIGSIDRIEIVKGPSAALYGNASGGILNITSKENFEHNYIQAGATYGSYRMSQHQFSGGLVKKNTRLIIDGATTRSKGFRDQSALENTNFNLRWFQQLSKKSKLKIQSNYTYSPIGEDPGSLNLDDALADRTLARDRNVTFNTGEQIQQFKVGANYQHQLNENESLQFYGFYNLRHFRGLLPFEFGGWVELQRNYGGQGGSYHWKKPFENGQNEIGFGYDLATQADARSRYKNIEGEQGELTLDQVERFSNAAIYALNNFQWRKWLIAAGLRQDWNRLAIDDEKFDDGDQSGSRPLLALNPSLGVNYEIAKRLHVYANARSSFETPSLSELSANPTGEPGFNESLESQRSTNFELGFKGLLFNKLDFDLTFFLINSQNDLVPFELDTFPSRTFYRNSGENKRQGVELWTRFAFTSALFAQLSYTYSDLTYLEYQLPLRDYSGNNLPGIPKHLASISLNYQNKKGFNARLQHRYIDRMFADDANETEVSGYHLTNVNLSYRLQKKNAGVTFFAGVNNIFDVDYFDNIRLNAFGKRYYETAPGVNVYGGMRCLLNFARPE